MNRLNYIDTVKGIGIILVVIGHNLLGVEYLNHWIYSFHMPLFFMISGFLYAYKNENSLPMKKIVLNKLKSLIYPYITLSTIILIWHFIYYNCIFTSSVPENTSKQVFFLSVSTFGYHALWFIPCLFFASVLFFFISKNKYYNFIIISIIALQMIIHYFFSSTLLNEIPYIYKYVFRICTATSFIYFGYILFNILNKISRQLEIIFLFCSLIISVILFMLFIFFPQSFPTCNIAVANIGNIFVYHLTAVSNCVWIILLCKNVKFPSLIIDFYGKNSILIMALHMDITVEIGWIILSLLNISLGMTLKSLIVIIIEFILLTFIILFVNKWAKFILKYPLSKSQPTD